MCVKNYTHSENIKEIYRILIEKGVYKYQD